MSYIQVPRLHFAGQFQADPSTVNNDPEHFDTGRFQSNYDLPGQGASNGWWNPGGTAAWRFVGCTVQQVVYSDGSICDDPVVDPVVGAPITGSQGRTEGKLVDLDPEQQMVSEIWGFQVNIGGSGSGFTIVGDFEVAAFGDIWVRFPQGQPDSFFGAFYQSVLQNLDWRNQSNSRFLKELEKATLGEERAKRLSIKFNVDGYNDDRTSPSFTLGRVVGSIGFYASDEPKHFLAARALQPVPGSQPQLNTAYALIDSDSLFVDVGNSFPTQSVGGPIQTNLGRLYVAAMSPTGPTLLGEIEYQAPNWYTQTSGITMLRLTADRLQLAKTSPLVIGQSSITQPPLALAPPPLLSEAGNGTFLRADQFVFRLNPGDKATAKLYATAFGQPMADQQIALGYDSSAMQGQVQQGPLPGPPVGIPESALTFPKTVTTGSDGTVELDLTAADPGSPRGYIDGQVYGVTYQLGTNPPPIGSVQNGSQFLSILVFSGYDVPSEPNWLEHVRPIFQQYADLYPVMRPIVNLADFGSVVSRRAILKNVFEVPVTDPNYMPVTRDLSEAKRTMIRTWLANPKYMDLDSVDDLILALQLAIELEHSTIPPYLCALYSIRPGTNVQISDLIRSVVLQEMLHMALVCNLLISIGGRPTIGHAKFVPVYPGPLPGGLRTGLIVRLRRCSIEHLRDCFMSIEEPEEIVKIRWDAMALQNPDIVHRVTIGWFYDAIKRALKNLAGQITFGNKDQQVQEWAGIGKLYKITSLSTALQAIDEIVHQGEGRSLDDPDAHEGELAHYYKFAEIVAGRRLEPVTQPETDKGEPALQYRLSEIVAGGRVERSGKVFAFSGAPIPFDRDGIWPMIDDPNLVLYPKGSRAQVLAKQFAESYQALLSALNRTFNGDPGFLKQAVGLMYSLDLQARELMQTPSGIVDGTTAGPSFQLPVPGI